MRINAEPLDSQEKATIMDSLREHSRLKREHSKTLYAVKEDNAFMTKDAAHRLAAEHDRAADRLDVLHEKLEAFHLYVSSEG